MSVEPGGTWGWWQKKRFHYNALLIIALFLSILSSVIIAILGEKYLPEVEFTIFAMMGQVFLIPVTLLLANLCYTGGAALEYMVKPSESERFRNILYRIGCGFSLLIVFYSPLLMLAKIIWRGWL